MADSQQRADVEIFGKTYTLVSENTPEYAREIAEDVNRRMVSIAARQNISDTTKIAMMAAMEIADELMRARKARKARLEAAGLAGKRLDRTINRPGE